MRKNGFTLVELLTVMTLLSILALMIYPAIDDYIDQSKSKAYKTQIENMISSTKNWAADHTTQLPDDGETYTLTLKDLIDGNYIDDVVDPTTKENFLETTQITIKNNNGDFEYKVNVPEK